jgi:geranylgeranyl pyrophosphate synthase
MGKFTLPVVKALGKVSREEREWIAQRVSSKPSDQAVVQSVIDKLEACGAIEDCVVMSRELIETGWQRLEPLIEDTLAKMMLRAFGWFVLERHY